MDIQELLRHRPFVRALARRLVKDEARADDLVQQTWLTAIEKPPRHGRSLQAWLGAVVRNLARTQNRAEWRRSRHEAGQAPGRAVPSPEETLSKAAWHQRLVAAVMELEEPYRTTILLRYFEDLDSNEIGAAQDVPPATVRTRLRRGIAQLRAKLDRSTEGGRDVWVPALVLLARPPAPAPAPAPAAGGAAWLVPAAVVATLLVGAGILAWRGVGGPDAGTPRDGGRRAARAVAPERVRPEAEPPGVVALPRVGHRLDVLVLRDGRPAGGAAVLVERAPVHAWRDVPTGAWEPVRTSVTRSDGHAWFAGLPAGYVRIASWKPGSARAVAYAYLPQAFAYSVVVELGAQAERELEIVDAASGAPVAGAWVGCDHAPAPDAYRADAGGRVRLAGLGAADEVRVRVDAPGYRERIVSADAGRVELEPADRVVRWPLLAPAPPDGTPVEFRRDGAGGGAVIEGGFLVARGLPRGAWPEHEAWIPGPRVARVEAPRDADRGPPVRFDAPRWLRVTLVEGAPDGEPVEDLPLRLQDPQTGQPLTRERRDGTFVRADDRVVRLAYRERGAARWRPLRDVVAGDVTVRLPEPVRVRLSGDVPERLAVYVDRELYEPGRARDGAIELELRPEPGRERARIDLLAHGYLAQQREIDLRTPGVVEWRVALEPASPLVLRLRGVPGELVLADPETGDPRWRGPFWFRLEPGPDGIVRESMVPPGRHVIRDLVRGVSSEPFEAPGALSLAFDLDAALPWVEGHVVGHAGLDLEETVVEAVPGGVVPVARDGRFRFVWRGPCELHARLGDRPEVRVGLTEPRDDIALAMSPVATVVLDPARPARAGRIVAREVGRDGPREGEPRTFTIERHGDLRFAGLPPGVYDLWVDLEGGVPATVGGVRLADGDNRVPVACDAGATLHVVAPDDIPVGTLVESMDEPRYRRRGGDVVEGIGEGRFRVTVWDRFTGLRLHTGEFVSAGHGAIPLPVEIR